MYGVTFVGCPWSTVGNVLEGPAQSKDEGRSWQSFKRQLSDQAKEHKRLKVRLSDLGEGLGCSGSEQRFVQLACSPSEQIRPGWTPRVEGTGLFRK